MIHQPLGGARGQATDIEIQAKEILTLKEKLNKILSETTNQSIKKIQADTERDYFMNAQEAVKYGLVDEILKIESNGKLKNQNLIVRFVKEQVKVKSLYCWAKYIHM